MDFSELKKDEDSFAFFDVQNLSIDHSLTLNDEIERYKELILSENNLHQIYFKDSCDLKTVKLIRDLLLLSDYIEDYAVDKYVLLNIKDDELKEFINDTYENPDTWKLPYEVEEDNYILTDIPRLRELYSYVSEFKRDNYSQLEFIMNVYDTVKLYDYEQSDIKEQLPEIINKKSTNSYGMNKLFSFILKKYGYNTYIGKNVELLDYYTLVEINDSKYNISGIYLFDPSMDTLSKEEYKKEYIRRMNYNFFLLNFFMLNRLQYEEKLKGFLAILSIENDIHSIEKIENSKNNDVLKEKEKIERAFCLGYATLHKKLRMSKSVNKEIIANINSSVYNHEKSNYSELLKENYEIRKNELFKKKIDEELEEMIKNEKK